MNKYQFLLSPSSTPNGWTSLECLSVYGEGDLGK